MEKVDVVSFQKCTADACNSDDAFCIYPKASVFDFVLDEDDMKTLNGMTEPANLAEFKALYQKCVCRDTPIQESREGVREEMTLD